MRFTRRLGFTAAVALAAAAGAGSAAATPDWGQWGQNAQHQGFVPVAGQPLTRIQADVEYDPFSAKENGADGTSVHYQTALLEGNAVYMEFKTGNFSNLTNWETQTWQEKRLDWVGGSLATTWTFTSDWKPVPYSKVPTSGPTWEPVFHAVLTQSAIYVPGASGSVYKLDKATGAVLAHVDPLGAAADRDTFVAGALTADAAGNVYYNVLRLDPNHPWDQDIQGAWLVKVNADDSSRAVTWASITPGTPGAGDRCTATFSITQLPWPTSPTAVPGAVPCGSQRPGINVAPAVAADGTIYDVSRAQNTSRWAYLIAVKPDLTSKWVATLRERFHDGCNVEIPANGTPGGCRAGAATGVDPAENLAGSGRVLDESSASPTVAPDGSIYYGAYTRYNYAQGHLMHFSKQGRFLGAYHFGWDLTPAIYQHDGTYSVDIKDNHYGDVGSYCNDPTFCPPDRDATNPAYPEEYFITQLDPVTMSPQWQYKNTNTQSCTRDASGTTTCTTTNPNGFEWCINAPAVDANGTVYANGEDGVLYAIGQGGVLTSPPFFLDLSIPAAYTPLSIGGDGKIYAQNFGHLVVVGR